MTDPLQAVLFPPLWPFGEIVRLEAEAALKTQAGVAVKEFARWVIQNACFEASDLDGGDVQDKALALGLLREEPYDPERHGDPWWSEYVARGEPWFVFSEILAITADSQRNAEREGS